MFLKLATLDTGSQKSFSNAKVLAKQLQVLEKSPTFWAAYDMLTIWPHVNLGGPSGRINESGSLVCN